MQPIDRESRVSLYEQVYSALKRSILSGERSEGERLPSKRALAETLKVSVVTVENAYAQLIAEGYVRAVPRSGFFVQYSGGTVEVTKAFAREELLAEEKSPERLGGAVSLFPFTVWARLMRTVILEKGEGMLSPVRHGGVMELRCAIADYLRTARGIDVSPRQIIVGAGTEYLYNLLIQLLGRGRCYGVENPGYSKLRKIYNLNEVRCAAIGLDEHGMSVAELCESGADVAHISPAHHFPTGIVMPISRRREIMDWAQQGERCIIEDDYDSELRFRGLPVPSMFSMDSFGSVIYVNTFSVTIAPSVRISYMCLPNQLLERFEEKLGFYACSVPAFEQYTLARFISEGYFERHINRSKKYFRRIRELVLQLMESFGDSVCLSEENAGLHFLVDIIKDEEKILACCARCGLSVRPLAEYYYPPLPRGSRFVANYAAAVEECLLREKNNL